VLGQQLKYTDSEWVSLLAASDLPDLRLIGMHNWRQHDVRNLKG
jgi:hypothetical protein